VGEMLEAISAFSFGELNCTQVDHTRELGPKQLDDCMGDTLISVPARIGSGVQGTTSPSTIETFTSRAAP